MHSSTHEPEAEEQANQFAAEFLMPEQHIKGELEKSVSVRNLMRLKMIYGVSMQALFERAYQLEIVTQTDRTNFYKMMAKRGWRKNEPQSDALPKESPTTYRRIVSELEKIHERFIGPAAELAERGHDTTALINAVAAALRFDVPEDPESVELQQKRAAAAGSREASDILVTECTGISPDHPLFAALSEAFAN